MRELVVHQLLARAAELFPTAQIVDPEGSVSYAEAWLRALKLANALEERGLEAGAVVGVLSVNTRHFFELHFALSLLGAVIHPLNFRLPQEQIVQSIEQAGDRWLFAWQGFAPLAEALRSKVKELIWLGETPYEVSSEALIARARPNPPQAAERVRETDDYTILHTTGTTGRPKAMRYRHRDLLLASLSILHHLALHPGGAHADRRDVFMPLIPFFHIHAWGAAFFVPYLGAKLVLSGREGPEGQLALIEREGVSWASMVPTQLQMLLEARGETPLPLKVLTGGSPLPRGLAQRAWRQGVRYSLIYGGSDQLATAISALPESFNPESEEAAEELATWVFPVPLAQVRGIDESGQSVKRDGKAIGEVVFEVPWLPPQGYEQDPQSSQSAYRSDGFHTKDLAVFKQDGRFYVVDREKDAIKSGGEWIPSATIEAILSEHPAVAQVAVLAVPDTRWGERPLAVLALIPGAFLQEEELRGFLKEAVAQGRIASYWIPDRFVFVEEIPLTSAGKLHKAKLPEMLGL